MSFLDFFKNKKNVEDGLSSSLFFHEDDFCQIELMPRENFDQARKQSGEIQEFAEKNFDGQGYTDMYIRPENKIKLRDRKILVDYLKDILVKHGFIQALKVVTGYGQSYREIAGNTVGYGKDYAAIYFDYEDNIVTNIWLTQPFNIDRTKLISFLEDAGKQWGLLLADWEATEIIDLSDQEAIAIYLS